MKYVYIDVENTLSVPFVSGIQRVTRRILHFVKARTEIDFRFIPIVHEPRSGWRKLTKIEHEILYQPFKLPGGQTSFSRIVHRFRNKGLCLYRDIQATRNRARLSVPDFEPGSIFLDMDSSWHNEYRRRELLPLLKAKRVALAALHYDIIPELFPEKVHPRTKLLFSEHLASQLPLVDLFICISANSKRDLLRYAHNKFPGQRVEADTIQLGSDIESLPLSEPPAGTFPSKYLLCVGTVEPRKNLELVIDALVRVRHLHPELGLVVVGRYGRYGESTAHRLLEADRRGNNLKWLQQIDDSQLAGLYRNAFLTVVPSFYEGCGLPVLEALRHGSLVLSSNAGALPEVGGTLADYFEPSDCDGLVKLILKYASCPALYQRRKEAVSNFEPPGWEQSASDLIDVLSRRFAGFS